MVAAAAAHFAVLLYREHTSNLHACRAHRPQERCSSLTFSVPPPSPAQIKKERTHQCRFSWFPDQANSQSHSHSSSNNSAIPQTTPTLPSSLPPSLELALDGSCALLLRERLLYHCIVCKLQIWSDTQDDNHIVLLSLLIIAGELSLYTCPG